MCKRTYSMIAAVACTLIAGRLYGAEAPAVARLVSKDGTLFARSKPEQNWQTVTSKGEIRAGDLLVGLPGAMLSTANGAVDLTLLTDFDKNSPYPVLEAAVVLHASADHDLDFTLDRGRVDVTNRKKEGAARVRIRFHDQQWEATLTEPGTRIALQLYGRWAKGVPFRKDPGSKDVPAADLLLLVRKGQVELTHGSCACLMSAPPGPALLHWDNSGESEEAPQKLEKLPDWVETERSDSERAQRIKEVVEKLRQQVAKSSPREAARTFVTSEDPNQRATGVIFMGALDDLEGLGEVITATKYPDAWDRAVIVIRHWLGRRPGMDQILYQGLIARRGLKPVQAAGVMQLLHSFGDAQLAQPELYTTLVKYLDNDVLGIRGLSHWHLVRLVPAGKDIDFNPLDPKDKRDKGREQWEKLIDDLLGKGELPPKQPAK
jgi:polyhydroxyalkanoate synthesis regulator phasin